MSRVAVIGCGVIGAAIAYELSQAPHLDILVLDRQPPAQASTGAALGVLMGIISQKVKGRSWQLREASIQRYATLIPELEECTGLTIPFNRHGILSLCFDPAAIPQWQKLIEIRRTQNWPLELWSPEQVAARCPHLQLEQIIAAIYSPQDGQIDPTLLTQALVEAAKQQGASFNFESEVQKLVVESYPLDADLKTCYAVQTTTETIPVDWVVVAAGLGSKLLTATLSSVVVKPILGQAMQLRLNHALDQPDFQPVINGNDIHIVPVGPGKYWIGATVEFPSSQAAQAVLEMQPAPERLEAVRQGAIALYPALSEAEIVKTWFGCRPRPYNRPAPIIEWLSGTNNILIATGHYRNGILLAPATAQLVHTALMEKLESSS